MGKLTTHVLDTANGRPARHMTIDLWRLHDDQTRTHLQTIITNQDGRGDAPLLVDEALHPGEYELVFHVRAYFMAQEPAQPAPFLHTVPVRFTIYDASAAYHVPLLVSPWAYSTYRGS